jgi:Bacteriophage Rz lysis protein
MSWLAVRLFLQGIPLRVYAILAGLLITVALVLGYGHSRYNAGQADVQAAWDAKEAEYALQRAEAAIAARNTEARWRAEYQAIADRFLKEQADADENHAAVVAGLRAGRIRVRDNLTCPSGRAEAATDAARAIAAGQTGLLPADAEFLLREAQRADAVARQLNALIEAVRAHQR